MQEGERSAFILNRALSRTRVNPRGKVNIINQALIVSVSCGLITSVESAIVSSV